MTDIIVFPKSICFRVTRKCNAKCDFCQAPNNYENPLTKKEIFQILNWCKKNKILCKNYGWRAYN